MRRTVPHGSLRSGTVVAAFCHLLSDVLLQEDLAPRYRTFLSVHCSTRPSCYGCSCCRCAPTQPLTRHHRDGALARLLLTRKMLVVGTSLQSCRLDHRTHVLDAFDMLKHARLHPLQAFITIINVWLRLRPVQKLVRAIASAYGLILTFVQILCVFVERKMAGRVLPSEWLLL